MEFKDIVKNRCSIRQFEARAVPEETIHELLDITRYAASAIDLQPWKIKIVSDQGTKDKLFPATFNQDHVRTCSHLFVFCADTDYPGIISRLDAAMAEAGTPDGPRQMMIGMATNAANSMTPEQKLQWSKEQVYIALGNTLNGAYSLGLGACPMTAFQPPEYAAILGLPDSLVPTVLVAIGYAAAPGMPKVRRAVADIVV